MLGPRLDHVSNKFRFLPWDSLVFDIPCYEIADLEDETLTYIGKSTGHFTIRVNPIQDRAILISNGFYYADTLLVPQCGPKSFVRCHRSDITIDRASKLHEILSLAKESFLHGRFHRDPFIPHLSAENRYANWIKQLHGNYQIISIRLDGILAAFVAVQENKLVLHAVSPDFRGQGIAKYLWSPVCEEVFSYGFDKIESSISAANLAALNLYSSLGFKFISAVDVYHLLRK